MKKLKLNSVNVKFEDSTFNYGTDVSCHTTEQSAKDYFVGQLFNVGAYPSEIMRKCVAIEFTDNNS
jgi:hypothetical protein